MAPLLLEGETLGQKHRHFNSLVKAAVGNQAQSLEPIDYSEPDAANLLRIDVACARCNVPYILELLRSPDLLYVTRAVKRSTWLITDPQHAHIVNPDYLERELFPFMTAKAKSKLLFAIKQNLKDESRVDAFFHYYEKDPQAQTAMKWLPGCSIATIEKAIKKDPQYFSSLQIQRLGMKSFKIVKAYCDQAYAQHKRDLLQKCTVYLNSHCDEYLDIVDSINIPYYKPTFKKNGTQVIMDKCRQRVLSNFEKYCYILHIPTFAQNMKSEEVQDFLFKQKENPVVKRWVKFENVRYFLKHIPKDTRLQFIKSLFVNKNEGQDEELLRENEFSTQYCGESAPVSYCRMQLKCAKRSAPVASNAHIYRWYRYLPFNTAMTELKKLIYAEPLPAERNAILTVLIKCAKYKQENIQTLLEYYRNKHVNEPFNFKIQFVNSVLSHTKSHEFDDNTWNILNNIFSSMEVYMESDNKVPFCINAIIVYKVLRDQDIPEIIEKKFTFSTFKDYRNKLNENQQNKLFKYLLDHLMKKIKNQNITSEVDMIGARETICNMLNLVADWNKNILEYPVIMIKIKDLIKIQRQNSWDVYWSDVYDAAKPWRKQLFEESLILHPSEEACLNALKHDPGLLSRYQSEVEAMCSNDTFAMNRVLRKIRVYWSDSIAQQWIAFYLQRVEQPKGRQAVKYTFILMPRHKIRPYIEENAPTESKIDWNEAIDSKLNLKKNIAKYMHLVRPPVSLDTILLYAKGDYLYHSMPSVNAILYNMSANVTSENITKLLDAPVSLQKHGICTIFKKLKYRDIKEIVSNLWKNTKNSSIKTVLFQQTFKLLCNEKNDAVVMDLWQLFSMYIESLSSEENAVIYQVFGNFKKVPMAVRPQFFMKGYLYLKSVTGKSTCDQIIATLFYEAAELVGLLEPNFVEDVLLEKIADKFVVKNSDLQTAFDILSMHILSGKNDETQLLRYEKLLLPLLQKAFSSWTLRSKGIYYIKKRCHQLLNVFISSLSRVIIFDQIKMPVKFFKTVQAELTKSLSLEENYEILKNWDLATLFVEVVDIYLMNNPDKVKEIVKPIIDGNEAPMPYGCNDDVKLWESLCKNVAPLFGEACTQYLKQDVLFKQYTTLHSCIREVLRDLLSTLSFNDEIKMKFLKAMLVDKDATAIYCIVINLMKGMYDSKEVRALKKEVLKILRSNMSTDVKINVTFYENNDLCSDSESDDDKEKK